MHLKKVHMLKNKKAVRVWFTILVMVADRLNGSRITVIGNNHSQDVILNTYAGSISTVKSFVYRLEVLVKMVNHNVIM